MKDGAKKPARSKAGEEKIFAASIFLKGLVRKDSALRKLKSIIENRQRDREVGHHWASLCLANITPSVQPKVPFKPTVSAHL